MPVTIRVMTIDDYDAVYALWQASEGVGLGRADTREAIERYLNRIYFGSGYYGIRSAALGYFGKEPRDARRHAGLEHRLSRRRLAHAALHDVAHDDFLHLRRSDAAALQCGPDGDGAKLRRREGREAPEVPADRGARGTDDHGLAGKVGHGCGYGRVGDTGERGQP